MPKRKIMTSTDLEPEPEPKLRSSEKTPQEMSETLSSEGKKRFDTMQRILDIFIKKYHYDESESIKFVDNIMKQYPFIKGKEEDLIQEEIKKYYEAEDKKLSPPPDLSPLPDPTPPPDPPQPDPTPPPLLIQPGASINQAFNALRDTLELTEDDPEAQLKAKRSKKRKKRKSKRSKSKRKVSKRKKKKTKRR